MIYEDKNGRAWTACFTAAYYPRVGLSPRFPVTLQAKARRDDRGRVGVFPSPVSNGGIIPMARVSASIEAALETGWPDLSGNGYIVDFGPDNNEMLVNGYERMVELPSLLAILELEGKIEETPDRECPTVFGSLDVDRETGEIRVGVDEGFDLEIRYWSKSMGQDCISSREMPTVAVGAPRECDEVRAILAEGTPERIVGALLDSPLIRRGASEADVTALKSGLEGILGRGPAGTESLKRSLDMRERTALRK